MHPQTRLPAARRIPRDSVAMLLCLVLLGALGPALAGLVVGMLVGRLRLRSNQCLRRFTPTIVAKIRVSQ